MPFILTSVIALILFATTIYFAILCNKGNKKLIQAEADLSVSQKECDMLHQEKARILKETEERNIKLLSELSAGLQESSLKNLEAVQEQFRRYAEENLKRNLETGQAKANGELNARKQAIESLLTPVQESIKQVHSLMTEMEKERKENKGNLDAQLKQLATANSNLLDQTRTLSMALKDNRSRGRWGEIQLRRIAEMSGMLEHCDFDMQVHGTDEGKTVRPDMVIYLPGNQTIVIDSKAPMSAFLKLTDDSSEESRKDLVREHAAAVKSRIQDLGKKGYYNLFENAPEFVILFLPNEDVLRTALEGDSQIFEYGMKSNVALATPATLIPILKTVAYSWRQYNLTQEARNISEQGRRVCDSARKFFEHMDKLGNNLKRSVNAYNDMTGSLNKNLMPKVRKLAETSSADFSDQKDMPLIDVTPRFFENDQNNDSLSA